MISQNHFVRRARLLLTFFLGQGCAQTLNLLSGFLVLRWLDVGDYAQYGLTFGFQTTINLLVDLGFSTTIIALVGHRVDERSVVGDYIRAGRTLRVRVQWIVSPLSGIVFFYLTRHLSWDIRRQCSLFASIVIANYFSGVQAYYTPPLIIRRKLGTHYAIQSLSASFRILAFVLAYKTNILSAELAVWTNTIAIAIAGILYRICAKSHLNEPAKANIAVVKQMVGYVLPTLPGVIFFALQGQISVFLIAAFGQNRAVAQVAALSRLGQVFAFVSALNPTILEPWFARSPEQAILRRYIVSGFITVVFSSILVLLAGFHPAVFLWILGHHYGGLHKEVFWTILAGCTNYLAMLTWTVISARRLVYWRSTFVNIALVLGTQISFLAFHGITTSLDAVQFGSISVAASLLAQFTNLAHGLRNGPRLHLVADQS
jgi:O-antigen/teichoic acid export membrane protein